MAGKVIQRRLNRDCPTTAKPASTPTMTRQATFAMRSRSLIEERAVIATKAGTVAIGSTITKRELNANSAYSLSVMRLSPLSGRQQAGPRVALMVLLQLFVERSLLLRDRRRHDDLEMQKQVGVTPRCRGQSLSLKPEF